MATKARFRWPGLNDVASGLLRLNTAGRELEHVISGYIGPRLDTFIVPQEFGAVGDGAHDDTLALQTAINTAATDNSTLVIPHGIYNFTQLFLQHHATLNPGFPTSQATRRGHYAIRGAGGLNQIVNLLGQSTFTGTTLNCTSTIGIPIVADVEAGEQEFPHRGTHLSDLTIIGNSTDWVMKIRGGQSWTYDRLRILQKNSGGNGLWLLNPDQVSMEDIVIVGNSPFGAGTVGFQFENIDIDSSGNYLHNFIIREFETTIKLGANPNTGNQTKFSTFSQLRCRDNDVGAVIADQLDSNIFLGCQFRGGVASARIYGRQRNSLFYACGFNPFGTPDVMLEIGDPAGTSGENTIRNIVFEGCLFNSINTLGVRWHGSGGGGGSFSNISNIHFRNNRFFESGSGTIVQFAGSGPPNGGSFVGNEIAGSPVAIYSGQDHTQGLDEWTDYTVTPPLLTRREFAVAGGTTLGGDLTVGGNLAVTGTTTLNNALTFDNVGLANTLVFEEAAGTASRLQFITSAQRWAVGRDGATESGANAGSNWIFNRFDDSGNLLGTALEIERATGRALFEEGIGIGNSATATGPVGNVVAKIEIFDETGTSLGFLPVYDAIT